MTYYAKMTRSAGRAFFPGRPCLQPEPQVEPGAGRRQTWVLASGSQLRLPPPVPAGTSEEIGALLGLASQRDAEALDSINYWDAGSPSLHWNEFAVERIIRNNLIGTRAARITTHLNVALYDAMVAAWDSKYFHRRSRPSRFSPALTTALPNPQSPSYPSDAAFFTRLGEEAADSRLWAGIHFRADLDVGLAQAREVARLLIERARNDGSQ